MLIHMYMCIHEYTQNVCFCVCKVLATQYTVFSSHVRGLNHTESTVGSSPLCSCALALLSAQNSLLSSLRLAVFLTQIRSPPLDHLLSSQVSFPRVQLPSAYRHSTQLFLICPHPETVSPLTVAFVSYCFCILIVSHSVSAQSRAHKIPVEQVQSKKSTDRAHIYVCRCGPVTPVESLGHLQERKGAQCRQDGRSPSISLGGGGRGQGQQEYGQLCRWVPWYILLFLSLQCWRFQPQLCP